MIKRLMKNQLLDLNNMEKTRIQDRISTIKVLDLMITKLFQREREMKVLIFNIQSKRNQKDFQLIQNKILTLIIIIIEMLINPLSKIPEVT